MNNFDKQFNRTRKLATIFFIIQATLIFAAIVGAIFVIYNLVTNPEGFGEFFAKIANGFNKTKTI